jgi:hypothetical protein
MKEALRKALETTGDGEAIVATELEQYLTEELLNLQPLAEIIEVLPAEGKVHEYKLRTSHPMGWFEGESTGPNNKNSAYARKSTMLKIARLWGSVTGFAQALTDPFIDALTEELNGSLEGMSNLLEYGIYYGCADDLGFTGDAFQYSGVFPYIARYAPQNIIDGAGAKIALTHLDAAIAKVSNFRQSRNDPKVWLMGLEMKQVVDGLQTRVQMPLQTAVLKEGKLEMDAYGKAPIFETDNVVPDAETTSPDDMAGVAGAGGTLSASYDYRIASVTMFGEQTAAAAIGAVDCSAGSQAVTLSWTADPNAKLYYIFRQEDGGSWMLLDVIPALTYDDEGKVSGFVEEYIDTGAKVPSAVKPLEDGEQQIVLLNRTRERGVVFLGHVDDMGQKLDSLMSYVELARTKDSYDYMLKSYLGARLKYANTAASVIRHVKRA